MSEENLYEKINNVIRDLSDYNSIDYELSTINKNNYPQELIVLHEICLLRITVMNTKSPYQQITGDVITDIAKNNLDILTNCMQNLENPLILGRIADILWLTKKETNIDNPIQYAQKAIENFSKIILSNENYLDVLECYQRALIISTQTRQNIDKKNIISQLNTALESEYKVSTPFYQCCSAEILLAYDLDSDFHQLADILINIGEVRYTKFGIHFGTIEYLELALIACAKAKNKEKEISLRKKITNIYSDEAKKTSNGIQARLRYTQALEMARTIPVNERDNNIINNLETNIDNKGKVIINQLFEIIGPSIDISQEQKHIKNIMQNIQTSKNALIKFSQIPAICHYESLKKSCIELNSQNTINSLISIQILSHDGRESMLMPSFNKDDISVVEHYMTKNFKDFFLNLLSNMYIDPAFQQLSDDHTITLDDLKEICQSSYIVPKDRVELVSKALYFGFQKDFQTAIYLLSPQVENIIRQLLKADNISTIHIDKDKKQTENGLSSLLDTSDVEKIIDKDILFYLKALFTSQLGPNLRNNTAHGLLNDKESTSQEVVYAWWFIFRWIMNTQSKRFVK